MAEEAKLPEQAAAIEQLKTQFGVTEGEIAGAMEIEPAMEGEAEAGEPKEGPPSPQIKEPVAAPVKEDWADDAVKELAESYGIDEEELKEFSSHAEFKRATRHIDRNLLVPAKQVPVPEVPVEEEIDLDPKKYVDAGYDDETVRLVKVAKRLQDELKQMKPAVGQFQALHNAAIQQGFNNAFHDTVDAMDETLYGRSVDKDGNQVTFKSDSTSNANRQKLWEAAAIIEDGIKSRAAQAGQQPRIPSLPVLLKRAEAMAFGEEIVKRDRDALTKRVQAQSSQRRPSSGGGKPSAKGGKPKEDTESIDSEVNRIMSDPKWQKAVKQITGE